MCSRKMGAFCLTLKQFREGCRILRVGVLISLKKYFGKFLGLVIVYFYYVVNSEIFGMPREGIRYSGRAPPLSPSLRNIYIGFVYHKKVSLPPVRTIENRCFAIERQTRKKITLHRKSC